MSCKCISITPLIAVPEKQQNKRINHQQHHQLHIRMPSMKPYTQETQSALPAVVCHASRVRSLCWTLTNTLVSTTKFISAVGSGSQQIVPHISDLTSHHSEKSPNLARKLPSWQHWLWYLHVLRTWWPFRQSNSRYKRVALKVTLKIAMRGHVGKIAL